MTTFETRVDEIQQGIDLCKKNAKRLLNDASLLLEHSGHRRTVYALWSLAVGEYGKSQLLGDYVAGLTLSDVVTIQREDIEDHERQITRGLKAIQEKIGGTITYAVTVTHHTGQEAGTIHYPIIKGDPSSVRNVGSTAPGATGQFEAVSANPASATASHSPQARLEQLEVDWDDQHHTWFIPEPVLLAFGLDAYQSVSASKLNEIIEALKNEIAAH